MSNPDQGITLELYNMLENVHLKRLHNIALPGIKVCKKIIIPQLEDQITLDVIDQMRKER